MINAVPVIQYGRYMYVKMGTISGFMTSWYIQLGQNRFIYLKSEEKNLLTSCFMYHSLDESSQLDIYCVETGFR
jgi:hypothetical protein